MSILTVSQLNRLLNFKIKSDPKLCGVAVKGEISNFIIHAKTGHAYFTVKDSDASIKGVMFASNVKKLRVLPQNGMEALVVGNVEYYERDGVCEIKASEITALGGSGAVFLQTEQLKEKLRRLGLFDEKNKVPIPAVPKKIAVITSDSGAALQDIINVVGRRYPLCEIVVISALVQGEQAAASVALGITRADESGADTVILARGGGSAEDLMPFNSEAAVKAVAHCKTPIITAVGHETDTTLVDYAADMRAPTPSAAAELATPDIADLFSVIDSLKQRLDKAADGYFSRRETAVDKSSAVLESRSPSVRVERAAKGLDLAEQRLKQLMESRLKLKLMELEKYAGQLNTLSPFNVLGRGYALVEKNGVPVVSADMLSEGDSIAVRLANGSAKAQITEISKNEDRYR